MKCPNKFCKSKDIESYGNGGKENNNTEYICKKCGKLKDYMDMNSKSLCKICWLKNDFNFYKNRFNRKGTKNKK